VKTLIEQMETAGIKIIHQTGEKPPN